MSTQPKALALADYLDIPQIPAKAEQHAAAAELRRLHALNAQMLSALIYSNNILQEQFTTKTKKAYAIDKNDAAIAAAKGQA